MFAQKLYFPFGGGVHRSEHIAPEYMKYNNTNQQVIHRMSTPNKWHVGPCYTWRRASSSAVERLSYTEEVGGSKPSSPTSSSAWIGHVAGWPVALASATLISGPTALSPSRR